MPRHLQPMQTDFYIQAQDLIIIPRCFHFCKILPVSAFWIQPCLPHAHYSPVSELSVNLDLHLHLQATDQAVEQKSL